MVDVVVQMVVFVFNNGLMDRHWRRIAKALMLTVAVMVVTRPNNAQSRAGIVPIIAGVARSNCGKAVWINS